MAPILPPDHKPLASPVEDVKDTVRDAVNDVKDAAPRVVRASLFSGVTALGVFPQTAAIQPNPVVLAMQQPQQADDPPTEDYSPRAYRVRPVGAIGSTSSSGAMPFRGNSDDTAAQAIRQRRMVNEAWARVAQAMPSTNTALLYSTGSPSTDMPFNNFDWPVPRRQALHPAHMMSSTSFALLSSTGR